MRLRAGAIALLLVLCTAACGGTRGGGVRTGPIHTAKIDVQLQEQNYSGEDGTATLTADGSKTRVVIVMASFPANAQPAHIHAGTCDKLGAIAYALPNIIAGKSTTVVPVSLDALLKGTYAINAHRSAKKLGEYVACGNITENAAPTPTVATGEGGSG